MTGTVRAAFVDRLGPPEAIRVGELPERPLGTADVRVDVAATAVNPVDAYVRSGLYRTPTPFPFIVGRDLAGRVTEVGPGVDGFRETDAVWCNSLGHGGRQGSFAERVVVPADRLYPLPEGVDPLVAAAAVHPAATAWLGLFREAGLRLGETVLVGGGAGNVGSAVVELATAAGAHVVATARPEDAQRCRDAGAATVLDYRDPDLARRIAQAAPAGVDVAWNTAGHNDLAEVMGSLADGARVIVTAARTAEVTLGVRDLYFRDAQVRGFVLSKASIADLAAAARVINDRLAVGGLQMRLADVLPLAATVEAHRRIEEGAVRGRLVVLPGGDTGAAPE